MSQQKEKSSRVGPVLLGFFMFVVFGSGACLLFCPHLRLRFVFCLSSLLFLRVLPMAACSDVCRFPSSSDLPDLAEHEPRPHLLDRRATDELPRKRTAPFGEKKSRPKRQRTNYPSNTTERCCSSATRGPWYQQQLPRLCRACRETWKPQQLTISSHLLQVNPFAKCNKPIGPPNVPRTCCDKA